MAQENQANTSEQIGFHKGALSTLAKERQELQKMLNIVEQIMHMHIQTLKEMGVDLEAQAQAQAQQNQQNQGRADSSKKIDDLL